MTDKLLWSEQLAKQLMSEHNLLDWEFRFNRRRRGCGLCVYPHNGEAGRIELSQYFCEGNPEDDIRDTILHEIAHALVGYKHGHNKIWKQMCVKIGAKPLRCSKSLVLAANGNWQSVCPNLECKKVFHLYRKPKYLHGWKCNLCFNLLTWKRQIAS